MFGKIMEFAGRVIPHLERGSELARKGVPLLTKIAAVLDLVCEALRAEADEEAGEVKQISEAAD